MAKNTNVWERFDRTVDAEKVMDTKSQFKKLPVGTYKAVLLSINADTDKNGMAMIKAKFRIKSNNRVVSYNHSLQSLNYPQYNDSNTAKGVSFFEDLTGRDYEFTSLGQFADDIDNLECETEHILDVNYDLKKDPEQKWAKISIVTPDEQLNDIDDEEYDDEEDAEEDDEEVEY